MTKPSGSAGKLNSSAPVAGSWTLIIFSLAIQTCWTPVVLPTTAVLLQSGVLLAEFEPVPAAPLQPTDARQLMAAGAALKTESCVPVVPSKTNTRPSSHPTQSLLSGSSSMQRAPFMPSGLNTCHPAGSNTPLPLLSTHTDNVPSAAPAQALYAVPLLLLLLTADAVVRRLTVFVRRNPPLLLVLPLALGVGGGLASGTTAMH